MTNFFVSKLNITNFRSFKGSHEFDFSPSFNIFVGKNNTGKSSILKAIHSLQKNHRITSEDIRKNEDFLTIRVKLDGDFEFETGQKILTFPKAGPRILPERKYQLENPLLNFHCKLGLSLTGPTFASGEKGQSLSGNSVPATEPQNLIYPFLSNRKTITYSEKINKESAEAVHGNFSNLFSKIDTLMSPEHSAHNRFKSYCEQVLDFKISSFSSNNGKKSGLYVNGDAKISLESMGAGIPNLLGLIVDLSVAKNKIFLIEELENDLHPQALKALLKLIIESSSWSQFFISTHSNIVTKELGGCEEAKIFQITQEYEEKDPISFCKELDPSLEARRELLEKLGYDFTDFSIWDGWLILEESSAERIIRGCLIPWFAPKLQGKLRTISSSGISQVEPKFEDLNRLFLFLHLTPAYKNKAWVLVDGDPPGIETVQSLKDKYKNWDEEHFRTLGQESFEYYYPKRFEEKVSAALNEEDKQGKRELKKDLLNEVLAWIGENEEESKNEFKESASEVIDVLKLIEEKLVGPLIVKAPDGSISH